MCNYSRHGARQGCDTALALWLGFILHEKPFEIERTPWPCCATILEETALHHPGRAGDVGDCRCQPCQTMTIRQAFRRDAFSWSFAPIDIGALDASSEAGSVLRLSDSSTRFLGLPALLFHDVPLALADRRAMRAVVLSWHQTSVHRMVNEPAGTELG